MKGSRAPCRRKPDGGLLLDWRLIAAAVAVLLVLGGGTLLAAQVQGDLDAGVQDVRGDLGLGAPDETPPLKLNDFKLPGDVALDIPEGARVSPDLSKLTLPEDMELDLPSDLDLSNLDFELPQDFDLQLPEGSTFTPTGLDLPNGGSIRLPDGRSFDLPAGSHLDIAPALADALRRQGVPSGIPLAAAMTVPVSGLPEGTHARLDPPQFSGGGSLRLPAGTTITLPDGQRFALPAGVLGAAARYLLPAGTTFDIPFDVTGSAGGAFPVPQPYGASQLAGRTSSGSRGIAVTTEITDMPSRVRKGEPVIVGGYVRELASGRAVAGAPVDVFLNESKAAPGQLVGQGVTGANGLFRFGLQLPEDKPAASYQLVNHAASFVDASGRLFADGWGDPPLATYASTALTLTVPARDGLGSRTTIAGTLVDHTGAPVSGLSVKVSVDGAAIGDPVTSSSGAWSLQHTFASGTHRVDARFAGTSHYEASAARPANITIADHVLDIPATASAKPGTTLLLSGRLLYQNAAVPERTLRISGLPFGAGTLDAVTDSTGRFATSVVVPDATPAGAYPLRYTLAEFSIDKAQTLEINDSARLRLDAPVRWDVEMPLVARLTLTSDATGDGLAAHTVRLVLAGPGGTSDATVATLADGTAAATLSPLRATPGRYTLTARAIAPPQLSVASVSTPVTLGVFEVAWETPATIARGETFEIAGTVTFADRPFALQDVRVGVDALASQGASTIATDAEGRFSLTRAIDRTASLGPTFLSVAAHDHPDRRQPIEIVSSTKLVLDAPQEVAAGEALEMGLRLVDDVDAPVADSFVTLTAVGPRGSERVVVRTDAEGRWKGPVNLTADEGDEVTLSARYDARRPYSSSATTEVMSVTAPQVRGPLSPWLWIAPLALVAVGGAAGGAWWYARKRAARTVAVPVVAATPAAAAPVLRAADFEVRFGIPADEPAVWGVGEPLELSLRDRGHGGEIEIAWNGASRRVMLAPGAEARTTLTFPEEGEVTVTARRAGRADLEPVSATVRIVDYPKETAREFDLFLERAKNLDARISTRSTPREIQWTLAERLGGATRPGEQGASTSSQAADEAEQRLEEIALVIEITNYSNDATSRSRAHYLRFVRASRALDPFFATRARVDPGPGTGV